MFPAIRRASSIALQRETAVFDACIVGAGPAGLAAAIKIKQLKPDAQVCVLEKAAEVGAHTVGGGLLDPRALYELLPHWETLDSPIKTKVTEVKGLILTDTSSIALPQSAMLHNLNQSGLHLVSQPSLVKWLASQAQALGVSIYPSLTASELAYSSFGSVIGVSVKDVGVDRGGNFKTNYKRGVEVRAMQTLLSEGCRGYLSEQLFKKYRMREWGSAEKEEIAVQTYGLGLKEVWRLPNSSRSGQVLHTFNWPLDSDCFGWGFLHWIGQDLHIGLVVSLDYYNPFIDPQREFQRFKTHPDIRHYLEGAECVQFGAQSINLGGFYSLPRLSFPGGLMLGCGAGLFNPAKAQGVNNAIKSGIIAGEAVAEALLENQAAHLELTRYEDLVRRSWLHEDMVQDRNYRQFFSRSLWAGIPQTWLSFKWLKGKRHLFNMERRGTAISNADITDRAEGHTPPAYLEPDGVLTFDKATSARLSRAMHEPDQPDFIKPREVPNVKLERYKDSLLKIEARVCPTGVFDLSTASACVHCKACDIKVSYLEWTPPEGGEGPF
jgi:electron-transferring-flavoprotein dehydrogenase